MTTTMVVATANHHKVTEIAAIFSQLGFDAVDLQPMTAFGVASPVEDGDSFSANALIKARVCCAATGLPALADDSGIEVDALAGAPGIFSARYAGDDSDDAANNRKLLAALHGVPSDQRTARFVCAVAAVWPDGVEFSAYGTMPGVVIEEERGTQGFGYDPLFVADATVDGRTNGQLSAADKDAISHRAAALRSLLADPQVSRRLSS